MNSDDLAAKILADIAAMPKAQQHEAVLGLIADALAACPPDRIAEIRAEIVRDLDPTIPVVADALDVIDGHIALRKVLAS